MKKKTKIVHTTGNRSGFVVLVGGDDNPALLRVDERAAVGGTHTKASTKAATIFLKKGRAQREAKKYVDTVFKQTELEPWYIVQAVGLEDKDHVTI